MPEPAGFPWMYANLGISVVLALMLVWTVWYALTKAHPATLATFAEQLKEERETCERRHQENLAEWRIERKVAGDRHIEHLAEKRATHAEAMAGHAKTHLEIKETRHALLSLSHQVAVLAAVVKGMLKVKGLELELPELEVPDLSK